MVPPQEAISMCQNNDEAMVSEAQINSFPQKNELLFFIHSVSFSMTGAMRSVKRPTAGQPRPAAVAPEDAACRQHKRYCHCPARTRDDPGRSARWGGAARLVQGVPLSFHLFVTCWHSSPSGERMTKNVIKPRWILFSPQMKLTWHYSHGCQPSWCN